MPEKVALPMDQFPGSGPDELAATERINVSYVCHILWLTLLARDIVEAILDGRQPEGMTLLRLMDAMTGQ